MSIDFEKNITKRGKVVFRKNQHATITCPECMIGGEDIDYKGCSKTNLELIGNFICKKCQCEFTITRILNDQSK